MIVPKRGEVWRIDFSGAHAYELVGDTSNRRMYPTGRKPRTCLIISADGFNKPLDTVTVLGHSTCSGRVTRNYVPRNKRKWSVPITADDNPWMNSDASIIDCNYIWTVPKSDLVHKIKKGNNDGNLAKRDVARVEHLLLRLLTGDGMPKPKHEIFQEGTVIEMEFREPGGTQPRTWFLVVSSPAWDWQRRWATGTCSVVKLKSFDSYDLADPLKSKLDVCRRNSGETIVMSAECRQIFTLQWKFPTPGHPGINRRMRRVGRVIDGYVTREEQLRDVGDKLLWIYLAIPE